MKKLTIKQVNVIYSNVKRGNLKMTKNDISVMYSVAKECRTGYFQKAVTFQGLILTALEMIDAIFSNDMEKAQTIYNDSLN